MNRTFSSKLIGDGREKKKVTKEGWGEELKQLNTYIIKSKSILAN